MIGIVETIDTVSREVRRREFIEASRGVGWDGFYSDLPTFNVACEERKRRDAGRSSADAAISPLLLLLILIILPAGSADAQTRGVTGDVRVVARGYSREIDLFVEIDILYCIQDFYTLLHRPLERLAAGDQSKTARSLVDDSSTDRIPDIVNTGVGAA